MATDCAQRQRDDSERSRLSGSVYSNRACSHDADPIAVVRDTSLALLDATARSHAVLFCPRSISLRPMWERSVTDGRPQRKSERGGRRQATIVVWDPNILPHPRGLFLWLARACQQAAPHSSETGIT